MTSPVTIPKGRKRPSAVPPDNSAGSIGRMHGDNTVKMPAKKAKKIRINIGNSYF
jgi:hypothetical protein